MKRMAYRPLADEIRPQTLDDVVGQTHILGKNGLLRRIVEGGNVPNLIFYGPSGTGKTTVANIIAQRTNRPLHRLNATTASISDIKEIMADIGTLLAPEGVLLYLDEIQYFNKKQQQSLLEFMEDGRITLIGPASLSLSRSPPRMCSRPSTGALRSWDSGWGQRLSVRMGCGSTLRLPAEEMCARP